jgi:hypothetical protein
MEVENSGRSHHVVDVSERIVDSDDLAVGLRVGEGSAGHKATDTAETVDSNGDGHSENTNKHKSDLLEMPQDTRS